MTEKSKAENKEKNPAEAVKNAVEAIKNKDAADSTGSKWAGAAKNSGLAVGVGLGLLLILSAKVVVDIFKFAKNAVEKEGNVGFGGGYKIGEAPPPFLGDKKDKK